MNIVERMVSFNDPNPQPVRVEVASLGEAFDVATRHVLSEPWRCAAYVHCHNSDGTYTRYYLHRREVRGPVEVIEE